jgi:hypothetical protein
VREAVQNQRDAISAEFSQTAARETAAQKLGRRLAQAVLAGWYSRVRAYSNLDIEQTQGAPPEGYDPRVTTFGTTFLAALAVRDIVLCLRVGDGDILVVDDQGPKRVFPLPEKEFGNATESLSFTPSSERSVHDLMELRVLTVRPRLVLVCSDGVSDPYFPAEVESEKKGIESELAHRWGALALENIRSKGWEKWGTELPSLLAELSSIGSFDDVSVAAAWWPEFGPSSSLADWAPTQVNQIREKSWDGWVRGLPRALSEWAVAQPGIVELSFAITALAIAFSDTDIGTIELAGADPPL